MIVKGLVVALLSLVGAVSAAGSKPHILHIMADDLGRADLSPFNNATSTPTLAKLIREGIWLNRHSAFRICSPTRASYMTGRYPVSLGWYDMSFDDDRCLQNYKTLPELLKDEGYSTVGSGKWDVGTPASECTPTEKGFDSHLGYYQACEVDYWTHVAPVSQKLCHKLAVDLSNSTTGNIQPLRGVDGIYSRSLYSNHIVEAVNSHKAEEAEEPLYMYFAPQNVHLGCGLQPDGVKRGVQAPCSTIANFPHIQNDVYKGQAGMLLELDWGVGNITAALDAAGYSDNLIIVFQSDNGGPLPHSVNGPYLRGGKWTYWEGGLRVAAFVSGALIPESRRGTTWDGLSHTADWYSSIIEGMVGSKLPPNTGSTPVDSVNVWDAIINGEPSPRKEIIHQVNNTHFSGPCQAITQGDMKLLRGEPGDDRIVSWPASGDPIAFGESGGVVSPGDQCRVSAFKNPKHPPNCQPHCLFNVTQDPTESHDLSGDPAFASLITEMSKRLDTFALQCPPESNTQWINTATNMTAWKATEQQLCAIMNKTGFLEPVDWNPSL